MKGFRRVTKLPIRWSAPEVLLDQGNFCYESDVWSFGVVLYELITNCLTFPYSFVKSNSDLKDLILAGHQLEPPAGTPVPYFSLMRACFQMTVQFRPSFQGLFQQIANELNTLTQQQQQQQHLHQHQHQQQHLQEATCVQGYEDDGELSEGIQYQSIMSNIE
eukprot:TRINITY_DN901_c0_g1_i6.p1 TRINITY_DN901_c0_g1~~TRINITY_DN901_c0_g1_i6.p1  ORF type:complete len:162 (-),score=34.49 TRINITY_DN901_c0_g1_i6:16-501(-)